MFEKLKIKIYLQNYKIKNSKIALPNNSETHFFCEKSGLQPEGLHPARGVARSGFRPLPNILDCSLP